MSALANQKPQTDGNGRGLKGPLISLDTLDGPTQRFWASCAFIALLAYKISFILSSSSSLSATSILSHPFFMTLLYCLVMSQLRVPKLDYSGSRWTFFFFCLIAFDWFFDGGWRSILTYIPILNWIASWGTGVCNAVLFGACDSSTSLSLSERRVSLRELISPSSHFLGQHTIHILPHATARFSLSQTSIGTSSSCFCLGPTSPSITVPISFNNTEPIWLQYSVTPFQTNSQDYDGIIQPQLFNVSISKNDLISETEALKEEGSVGGDGHGGGKVSSRKISSASSSSSKGNWRKSAEIARQKARGDGKSKSSSSSSSSGSHFKPSTKIYYLQISQVGRIRLEQVVDSQKNGASPSLSEIVVVECPSTAFNLPRILSTSQEESQKSKSKASTLPSAVDPVDHYCPSDSAELEVFVYGTSPLELEYSRTFTPSSVDPQNKSKPSKKEKFTFSHISSPHPQGLEAKESLPVAIRNEKGRSNSNLKDYSWALSQEMRLPVAMDLVSPGKYSYRLETVRDACGNSVDVSSSIASSDSTSIKGSKKRKALLSSLPSKGGVPPSAPSPAISSREIVVHPRPKIAFSNCSAGKSLKLLKDGPSIQLALGLKGVENQRLDPSTDGGPWEANVAFIPDSNSATSAWERNLTIFSSGPRASQLQANSSGTYTLSGVSGRYCSGEIASPWSCQVEYIPPPTASIEFSSIEDRCAGQVGIKALVLLSGTPPFTLSYQTTEHGKTSPAVKTIERIKIDRTRHEIEFRPHTEGKVTYAFVELRDANYEKISLDGPVTTQEVHPLATASFLSANGQKSPKASPVPQTSASRRAIQQRDSIEQLREGLAPQRVVMHSCTGDDTSANAEVELSGTGPFDLTYTLRSSGNTESEGGKKHGKSKSGGGSSSSETTSHTVKGISGPKHTLDLDLPSHISQRGGEVTLSLVNIKDARGCERPLVSPDIIYEVRRDRPTVSFVSPNNIVGEAREIKILEGQEATLPLRLEGNSPWDLEYVRLEPDEDVEEALKKLRDPSNKSKLQLLKSKVKTSDGNIKVNKSGRYVIFSSKDSFCNGEVLVAKDYLVSSKPKPEVHYLPDSGVQSSKNVSLLRAPVCRGKADSVDIEMRGRFPIHIGYEHSIPSWSGSDQVDSQIGAGGSSSNSASSSHSKKVKETFSSAQNVTSLQLSTSIPGWHVYELKEIGDALYPVTQLSSDVRSSSEGSRRLEQMVYPLPSVSLSSSGKPPSFCLHDSLSPSNFENSKGGKLSPNQYPTLSLAGTPPFSVEIELRHLPSGSESSASIASDRSFTIDNIQTHTHPIELSREQFSFDNTGSWNLKVKGVRDKNDCFTTVVGGKNGAGINLEVAETASITSKGNRDDYCVGESVDFVLQGSAPWTVTYNFAGKKASASVRNPDFSRIADKAGELRIESVAHQQNKCKHELKKNDTSLIKTVHDLPTVKVSAGRHFIEDLREGNQAEIIFDLNGVPPFSFTYQRTETVDTHSHPKVLETHTVTGILEHRYSIWTSLEGTWTVNWLQDRWCAVSIDGGTATGLGRGRLAIEN